VEFGFIFLNVFSNNQFVQFPDPNFSFPKSKLDFKEKQMYSIGMSSYKIIKRASHPRQKKR